MVNVAQLVEPRIVVPVVVGSSPIVHPILLCYNLGAIWCWQRHIIQDVITNHSSLCLAVSATTRSPRSGEVDGDDYHFLSNDEFDHHVTNSNFLEWCHVHQHRYGTLKTEVTNKLSKYKAVIIEIDVQGAQEN